jgi:hypothetical protein
VTILNTSLNCLRLATYDSSREQDRLTLSRTDYEPRIVSVAPDPFPQNLTLGDGTRSDLGLASRASSLLE